MAIIYVDSLAGNDANPGTLAAPKATPRGAFLIHNAFDEISFKAGRCYAPYNGFFPRITKNGVKVTAYGLTPGADKWDDYPIWDGLTYENSGSTGWTHEGSGVWSKSFGTGKAKRIWFGSHNGGVLISQRTIGTAYSRTPNATADDLTAIKAALNSTDRWHSAGSALGWKLYIYTGSTTVNPPTFYSGLAILICDGATIGAEEGIFMTQCTGARASKIHIRGTHGDSGRIASGTTDTLPTDDNIITDCISSCNGVAIVWSIRVGMETNGNPRKPITNCFITNIEADSKSSQYEQDKTTAYNHISAMDMFFLYGNCYNCHIWDFKAINSAHVGAAMGGQANVNNQPTNCSILRGYIKFDSWVTYGRGISANKMVNSVIGECIIDGQNVRSQFADGWIVGNKWINMRASIRKPSTDEWAAVECYVYDYGGGDPAYRYETRQPDDLLIANNFVDRPVATPGAYPFLMTTYSSTYPVAEPNPPIALNTVRIYNNILILPEFRQWLGSFANGGTVEDQLIKNNIIYTSGDADATVRWLGASPVSMNSLPGHTGNMNVNPLLDVNHKPTTGSPAIGAGVPIGSGFKDQAGVEFSATTPTIGAYEVPPSGGGTPPPPPPPIPISDIINDRDVMMQGSAARYDYVNSRTIVLNTSHPHFKVTNTGTSSPTSIDITAELINLPGVVTFSTSPSVTLTTNGNVATLAYADMTADLVEVTATLNYGGLIYTATPINITKVVLQASLLIADEMVGLSYKTSTGSTRLEMNVGGSNKIHAYSGGVQIATFGGTADAIVYAKSGNSMPAIFGDSTATSSILGGVAGFCNSTGYGVWGSSSDGPGVRADSTNSSALLITSGTSGISQTGGGANFMRTTNPASDNAWSLGGASYRWTNVYATSGVVSTSDVRTKTEMSDTDLGLDFVLRLGAAAMKYKQRVAENIVTDNWVVVEKRREVVDDFGDLHVFPERKENQPIITQRPGNRFHYGFPAQEVRRILLACGVPDSGIWCKADPNDPNSLEALRHEEMIAPITRGILIMHNKIVALEAALDVVMKRLEALERK